MKPDVHQGSTGTEEWCWQDFLAKGEITLLTSLWKTGKSTLVSQLIRLMGTGGELLGRTIQPGRVHIISEESLNIWASRHRERPFSDNFKLWSKPSNSQLSVEENCVKYLLELVGDKPSLIIIDPISMFFPLGGDCNPKFIQQFFSWLTAFFKYSAVLLIHHPRKANSESRSSARGSGLISSIPSILLDLRYESNHPEDRYHRRLFIRSRFPNTIDQIAYRFDPTTGLFSLRDAADLMPEDRLTRTLLKIIDARPEGLTVKDCMALWPHDQSLPHRGTVSRILQHAVDQGELHTTGLGSKHDPYRYARTRDDVELQTTQLSTKASITKPDLKKANQNKKGSRTCKR